MKYSQILFLAMAHVKCRGTYYPNTAEKVKRFLVPNDKVNWNATYEGYKPTVYTADYILAGKDWADTEEQRQQAMWNYVDGAVNRVSFTGTYKINIDGYPLNPKGRTGVTGRGHLGRWGPNHAADPIVTRWKRGANGISIINPETKSRILQFVAIKRGDCGEWALPGGMVDPGESVTKTLLREFLEEAVASADTLQAQKIQQFFQAVGIEMFRGYVDDPRNTDNAWMETVACLFHDDTGEVLGRINLEAGDDAVGVKWQDLTSDLKLYASHINFLGRAAVHLDCEW